VVPPP